MLKWLYIVLGKNKGQLNIHMETKPTPKSTTVSRFGRKKVALAIIGVIFVVGGIGLAVFVLKNSNDSTNNSQPQQQAPQQNTNQTVVPEVVLSQNPLNPTAPTGKQLEDKVAQSKEQITKLEAEIDTLGAPQSEDQQVTLATKYLELGQLYSDISDFNKALDALSNIYNPSVISQNTLYKNLKLNMDAQGLTGLVHYNTGNYQSSLTAYQRALDIANYKLGYEGAPVFSPEGVIKYTQAIKTVQEKI